METAEIEECLYINFCSFVGLKVICTGCNTSSKGLSKRWTVFLLTLRSPTTWPPNTRTNTRMSRMSCTHFRKSLTKAVYSCQGKVYFWLLPHKEQKLSKRFTNLNLDVMHLGLKIKRDLHTVNKKMLGI